MMLVPDASFTTEIDAQASECAEFAAVALPTHAEIATAGLIASMNAPPAGIADAIDALAVDHLPNFRFEASVAAVTEWLEHLMQTPGLSPAQSWIVGDVARQARHFAAATGAFHLALKLEVVRDDACRKLHHDYVTYRLVCVYRGPGTQWLPRALEAALGDERDLVPDDWLKPVPRFAGALFAGRLLPGAQPILHRSPPISGTGEVRLVLTINAPFSGRYEG